MTQAVNVPGVGTLQFPDGMSQPDMAAAIQKNFPQIHPQPVAEQPPSTFVQRMQAAMGVTSKMFPLATAAGDTVASLTSSGIAAPVSGLAGAVASPAGNDIAVDTANRVNSALTYQPRTEGGRAMTKAASIIPGAIDTVADKVGSTVSQNTNSPALGAATKAGLELLPALLLKGRGKAASLVADERNTPRVGGGPDVGENPPTQTPASQAGRPAGLAEVSEAPPAKEVLKSQAQAAYKRAEDAGVVITPDSFDTFKKTLVAHLEKQGVDPDLHPNTTAAVGRIASTEGPVTLSKLETLRRIAQDAEGAQAPADKRLAAQTVDMLDNYAETLSQKDISSGDLSAVPALQEARNLWSRARKADTLDELVRRAEISAPNFSGSGMENALRTEFRSLAKNQNRMRRFTPDERTAIERVAKGAPMENLLRFIGKAAPTGIVSAGLGTATGMALGGPAGAAAVPAIGAVSRLAAKRMTMRNVERANELVRTGPGLKPTKSKSRNALAPVN